MYGIFKKNEEFKEAIGKSRGWNTTKLHVATNMQGIPIKIILSSSNRHDIKFAEELIKDTKADTILADRGYDANWFRNLISNPL